MILRVSFVSAMLLAFVACSDTVTTNATVTDQQDSGTKPGADSDGSSPEDEETSDAGTDAPAAPSQTESEPNNGETQTQTNPMTLPGSMGGAIDPKGDADLFAIGLVPGELWSWTMTPIGADLAPSVTVFDTGGDSPTVLATAAAGQPATLEHFVLATGTWIAAARDARNVGGAKTAGGPTFKYVLEAKKKTVTPTAITVPSTKTGSLASLGSVDLYAFTLAGTTELDVILRAQQKAIPSTLDSRISIFNTVTKTSLGTNDNASGSTTDSKLGGTLPAGSYVVVVENEGTNGADLSYEIELALQ
jgi:hypothetical protein